MVVPVGINETRVARWPVVTLTLAVLTLGITGSVAWHNHLTHSGTWFEGVSRYWQEHPDLQPPDGCATYLIPPLPDDPSVPRPQREPGDSRKLASLCLEAMKERSDNQPLWLVRQDKGLMQIGTITHGLAFPNIPSALIGLQLLVLVLGSFLEDRWGRDRFATFWVLASVAAAVAFQENALKGAEPLAGGNALSAACVGAFMVTFGKQRIQFALFHLRGTRHFFAPAWSVGILWLVLHLLALALTDGRTPADSVAELAACGIGAVVGLIGRMQQWQAEAKEEMPAAPEPNWVKSSIAPSPSPDSRQPQANDAARATPQNVAPMFDDSPHPPAMAPSPPDTAPLFDDLPRFGEQLPVKLVPAPLPEPVPLDESGGWARFAHDAPVLPAHVPSVGHVATMTTAPGPRATTPPLSPMAAGQAEVAHATAFEAKSAHANPVATVLQPSFDALAHSPDAPTTPYWTLLGRDRQGLLLRDEDGVVTRLDARHLLAVAVGVVQIVDVGAPGPALIFDLVMDVRPPRCVRVRPTPDVLTAAWPGLTRQEAVVALARELAAGGAIRVPQVPEWPGPPWSAFPDTRSLMAAWQLALARR